MRKRNRQVPLRLNEKEYAHLKRQAEIAGYKTEPFMRALIMGTQLKPRPPGEYAALLRELSAIGNNINQIARLANMEKRISPEALQQIHTMQAELWKKVKNL